MKAQLGIDIGGTNIKFLLRDIKTDEILEFKKIKTQPELSQEKIILNITKTIKFIFKKHEKYEIKKIGIGVPGLFEKDSTIRNLPFIKNLNGVNFKKIFKKEFNCQTKIVNDAQLPYHFHKSKLKEKHVAYLTLGTSLGCSLVLNKKLHIGSGLASQLAGSYFISTKKNEKVGFVISSVTLVEKANKKGLKVKDFKELISEVKNNNKIALKLIEDYGEKLGFVFRNIYQILHLEKIYLTGGISTQEKFFLEKAIKTFEKNGGSLGTCSVEILTKPKKGEIGALGASKL